MLYCLIDETEQQDYGEIFLKTRVLCSTVQRIAKGESSHTMNKGKVFKPKLLQEADIKHIFCFVSES
jgi:hypothetical protein